MRLAALMAAATVAAGCHSPTASDSVAETEWLANRDKWRAAGVTSYEMQMRSECFCGAPTESVRLVVRNGAVQSRIVVETGAPVDAAFTRWFPDVLGLFGVVRNALDREATYVGTKYDATYGYPNFIQIDFSGGSFGDKVNYYVERFTVLP